MPPLNIDLGGNPLNYGAAQVGTDSAGNSYAIWAEEEGRSVSTAILPFGASAWTGYSDLWVEVSKNEVGLFPQISVAPNGHAIAVWCVGCNPLTECDTPSYITYYSFFNGVNWSTATPIDLASTSSLITYPQVAIAPSGNAIAVWDSANLLESFPVISTYNATSNTWTPSIPLSNKSSHGYTTFPQIAVDAAGNGVAIWQRADASQTTTVVESKASPFAITTSPALVAQGDLSLNTSGLQFYGMVPKIALNSEGNGIAVWDTYRNSAFTPQAKSYINGLWTVHHNLYGTNVSNKNTFPQPAINASGLGVATWFVGNEILAARRNAKGHWTNATEVTSGGTGLEGTLFPQIAMDQQGQAVIVYVGEVTSSTTSYDVVAQISHGKSNRWKSPTQLSAFTGSRALPQVASNSEGDVTAIWTIENGAQAEKSLQLPSSFGIVQSSAIILKPANGQKFRGAVISNTFPMQTECVHTLSWLASSDATIVEYLLYAGKTLIGTFPNNKSSYSFTIRDACCGQSTTYQLIAVNAEGLKSLPSKVVLQ
jgi:hypothetical protein